jgi:Na+-translocating ferredoxin:NAD+ oxidoreductase RnfG subunit
MTQWSRWSAAPAIVLSLTSSAHAVQYLTVEQAQKLAFPSATQFVALGDGHGFRAEAGGRHLGLFIVDHVVGKHLYIDYTVALDPEGHVHRVEILQYRESYGGDVRSPSWLGQFAGKTNASALTVGSDIRNISGATLSSLHVTEGVKRILAVYGSHAR